MNEKFENQKERLLAINQEISLLYQQVNYLLRNEKPIELLDLDVLMNRTHSLYNQLCSINLGEDVDDEDIPFDADAFMGLFGGASQEEPEETKEEETAPVEDTAPVEEPPVEEPGPMVEFPTEETAPMEDAPIEEAPQVVETKEENPIEPEEKPEGDAYGIFFHFEDIPEEKEPETTVENDGKVVHVMEAIPEDEIPERDLVTLLLSKRGAWRCSSLSLSDQSDQV